MITKAIVMALPENRFSVSPILSGLAIVTNKTLGIKAPTLPDHRNKYKVRIPIFDGYEGDQAATANEDLSWATLCCIPGLTNALSVGDIVYVGFEDDDYSRPVILGQLFMGYIPSTSQTSPSLHLGELVVDDKRAAGVDASNVKLPTTTTIGDLSPIKLKQLSNLLANSFSNKDGTLS